jgi:CBS domain-containing protein
MAIARTRNHKHQDVATAAANPVSAIMTRNVVTVPSGTSLDVVAELMLARGLSRIPVLDESGHLIGIVSKTDLVEKAHDAGDTSEPPPRDVRLAEMRGFHVHGEGAIVDEVMSRSVMAVDDTATIQRAAQLMVGARIHGLPVVTASGALVGFVSTMDILAWLSGLR